MRRVDHLIFGSFHFLGSKHNTKVDREESVWIHHQ